MSTYQERFGKALMSINDYYSISLPFIYYKEGKEYECLIIYYIRDNHMKEFKMILLKNQNSYSIMNPGDFLKENIISIIFNFDYKIDCNNFDSNLIYQYENLYEKYIADKKTFEEFKELAACFEKIILSEGIEIIYRNVTSWLNDYLE